MKIETKYSNGDRVWLINQRQKKEFISCSFCSGTGIIKGSDKTERTCPDCYGRKGNTKWLEMEWQVEGSLTIGRVGVEVIGETKGHEPDSIFCNYGPQKYEYKEEYMCLETGIGTGRVYEVACLFPTREEALAECELRNNKKELAKEDV